MLVYTLGVDRQGLANTCCGMMFNTRGFKEVAETKLAEVESALLKASENGKYPIVCDTSPCLSTIKGGLTDSKLQFSLYEPVEFIRLFLADKLEFQKVQYILPVEGLPIIQAKCCT